MKNIIFLASIFLLSLKSYATSELYSNSEEVKEILNNNVYEPNYFSMILGLIFVVFLIYVTGYIYQKLTKVKLSDTLDCCAQVISTTQLGQGRNLHVIKIMDDYCLIGSTQNSITFLKDVDVKDNMIKQELKR